MAVKLQTIGDSKRLLHEALKVTYSPREASAVASFLIESVTGLGIVQQLSESEKTLTGNQADEITSGLQLLLQNHPVQYVAGYAWFMERKFFVNPGVLIPRQETEELVTMAIRQAGSNFRGTIIDFCTGSGCIAVSLAKSLPAARVFATDISEVALETAGQNAIAHGTEVTLLKHDLTGGTLESLPEADILVSNPPYVRDSEMVLMEPRVVQHEPPFALFVRDSDPLLFYRHLLAAVEKLLIPGGWFCFEINEAMGDELKRVFDVPFISDLKISDDINSKNRFISGTRG
jgi:release factor glutamine methyltransferase